MITKDLLFTHPADASISRVKLFRAHERTIINIATKDWKLNLKMEEYSGKK